MLLIFVESRSSKKILQYGKLIFLMVSSNISLFSISFLLIWTMLLMSRSYQKVKVVNCGYWEIKESFQRYHVITTCVPKLDSKWKWFPLFNLLTLSERKNRVRLHKFGWECYFQWRFKCSLQKKRMKIISSISFNPNCPGADTGRMPSGNF